MPLIDLKCANDHITEANRPLSMYPATPSCSEVLANGAVCGEPTEQIHLPRAVSWTLDPVVVYKTADGSFRFPGDVNGAGDAKYAAMGYERIELRSAADVRRFEGVMNKREYSRAARRVERMHQFQESRAAKLRGDLRQLMQSMSPAGRALARAVMARNDAKQKLRPSEANFHLEAFSFDHSNRGESRDSDGRRRRD